MLFLDLYLKIKMLYQCLYFLQFVILWFNVKQSTSLSVNGQSPEYLLLFFVDINYCHVLSSSRLKPKTSHMRGSQFTVVKQGTLLEFVECISFTTDN